MSGPRGIGGVESASARRAKAATASVDLAGRLALRPAELARAMGCSERLIRGQLHRIPHVRIGGALFFPVDGIRAWLVSQAKAERRQADEVIDSLRSRIAGDLNES